MTTIPDVQLYAHAERLQGKVVLITGEGDVLWRTLSVFLSPVIMQAVRPVSGEKLLCNTQGRSGSLRLVLNCPQWLITLDIN